DAYMTGSQRMSPARPRVVRREAVLCSVKTKPGRRSGAQRQVAEVALVLPLRVQLLNKAEIDALNVLCERVSLGGAQLLPEVQQMLLAERPKHGQETIAVHVYQPMTMFDSMAFRACSKSVPVWCMYRRMACSLSPSALERQSRAVEQGSALPLIPKAALEM